jgi:hypothetical protein
VHQNTHHVSGASPPIAGFRHVWNLAAGLRFRAGWGYPQGRPHVLLRVLNIPSTRARLQNRAEWVSSLSKEIDSWRTPPHPPPLTTRPPWPNRGSDLDPIARQATLENALIIALHFMRQSGNTPVKRASKEQATGSGRTHMESHCYPWRNWITSAPRRSLSR